MKITILAILTLAVIGCAPTMDQGEDTTNNSILDLPSINNESSDNEQDYHAISLPAFAEREFTGRNLKIGQVLMDNASYTRYYITYKSAELTISGIMNVPKGDGPFPVLILNHGYIDPAVYTNGRGLKREQDYFAKAGYVVIHPDYRNHAQSSKLENDRQNLRLGYTQDVVNAVYAVRNSEFDFLAKDKIGMLGHSMGGGITQNILVSLPDLINAAVLYAPVSADYRDNFDKWGRDSEDAAEVLANFGNFDENPQFWDNISPINFVERISVPILIQHGTIDDSTPIVWSEQFVEALNTAGKTVTFKRYENAPHEFIANWPEFMATNVEFFDRYLK